MTQDIKPQIAGPPQPMKNVMETATTPITSSTADVKPPISKYIPAKAYTKPYQTLTHFSPVLHFIYKSIIWFALQIK